MVLDTSAAVSAILPLIVIALILKLAYTSLRGTGLRLPPRPKPLPLIGNLFDVTGDVNVDCRKFETWCKDLSTDILYVEILGTSIVYLNTYEACTELLDKRSAIYSGRARMPMINELMGWDFSFAFMNYGEKWRNYRKLAHQQFNASAVKDFRLQQLMSVRGLIKRLQGEPEDIVQEMRRFAGEDIMFITYGLDIERNKIFAKLADEAMSPLHEVLSPGAFLVDTIPLMKYIPVWFPGAGFQRKARHWKHLAQKMVNTPFSETKKAIEDGEVNSSFVKKSLDNRADEEAIKSVAGLMYQAGLETTNVALSISILALLEHPDVIKKAQKELDSVIPSGMLPDFDYQDSLPYITAIVKEVLRWHVISPTGIPHTSIADDTYNGYHIPAGTMVLPNNRAILHDDKVFPNPELFIPERFMNCDDAAEKRLEVTWGYGRRICAGRFLAVDVLWITLASILTVFDISKPIDKNGNIIHPSRQFTDSILPIPAPFKAVFTPRNEAAKTLMNNIHV